MPASLPPVNPYGSSPRRSGSGERRPTATCPNSRIRLFIRGLEVVNHPREDARFELLDALSKHAAEHADELDASEAPRLGVTKRVVDRRSVAGLVA